MTDRWTEQLSEYVDGELTAADASQLEDHLQGCADCRAVLDELRLVVARASALDDREPSVDLWPAIAERMRRAPTVVPIAGWRRFVSRRVAVSVPQLAAASLALILVGSGALWMALGRYAGVPPVAAVLPVAAPAVPAASPAATYGAAIADLELVLRESRASLDSSTVRVIEESLVAIDRAITEAETALAEDPASRYLQNHLNFTMQRKLELLNQAAALATASS